MQRGRQAGKPLVHVPGPVKSGVQTRYCAWGSWRASLSVSSLESHVHTVSNHLVHSCTRPKMGIVRALCPLRHQLRAGHGACLISMADPQRATAKPAFLEYVFFFQKTFKKKIISCAICFYIEVFQAILKLLLGIFSI